eukprot:Clim_evm55s191 gene=Clim_evmTU55s191
MKRSTGVYSRRRRTPGQATRRDQGPTTTSAKEQQKNNEDDGLDDLDFLEAASMEDTLVIIQHFSRLMRTHVKKHFMPPFVLRHMIYTRQPNRTVIDREIQSMVANGKIHIFELPLLDGATEAILTAQDYRAVVDKAYRPNSETEEVQRRFVSEVRPSVLGPRVSKSELIERFAFDDEDIKTLMRMALIATAGHEVYRFNVPNAASYMRQLTKSRKEYSKILRRKTFGRMQESDFMQRYVTGVEIPVVYQIADLIGLGRVEREDGPSGSILRLLD